MIEYTLNRENANFSMLQENSIVENKLFANIRTGSNYVFNRLTIQHSTFASVGFKDSKFTWCKFFNCIFIECYFKPSQFENCSFIGCKFINCNLEKISISICDFKYSEFVGCYIDYKIIKDNLPKEHNLRWKLCRNLSLESLKLGDIAQFKRYYFEERESSEKHYIEIIRLKDDYYRKHFNYWDVIGAVFSLTFSKINKVLWGYGEKIQNLIYFIIVTILLFSLSYLAAGTVYIENGSSIERSIGFFESLYLSASNFFTLTSDITSHSSYVRIISSLEGFTGISLMGFFVAALFRFINRR